MLLDAKRPDHMHRKSQEAILLEAVWLNSTRLVGNPEADLGNS
jgi:hypothetical protein